MSFTRFRSVPKLNILETHTHYFLYMTVTSKPMGDPGVFYVPIWPELA